MPNGHRRARLLVAAGLLACACAPGGASAPETTVAFEIGASVCTEGAGPVSIAVVLHTERAALPRDVQVGVRPRTTASTAASGDFPALAEVTVTFPSGSVDGAVQVIAVEALDDDLVEGASEVLRLELFDPVQAAIGARGRHTLSIADADAASIAFASAASATADEAEAPAPIAVVLALAPGVTLGVPIDVQVSDTLSGSATRNSDYAKFVARTLTFPSGAGNGELLTANVDVKHDVELEGDETVVLELSQPAAGASLGAVDNHTLTITDDELSSGAFLSIEWAEQALPPFASGDALDFGSLALGAAAPVEIRVAVRNLGAQPLDLAAPILDGTAEREYGILLEPATGSAAALAGAGAPAVELAKLLDEGARTLAPLQRARLSFEEAAEVELTRIAPPFASDAVLAVDGAPDRAGFAEAVDGLSLWRARDGSGGAGFVAVSDLGVRGWLASPNGGEILHLVSTRAPDGRGDVRALPGRAIASAEPAFECAGALEAPSHGLGGGRSSAAAALPRVRLALETDYQLYLRFGGVPALVQYVTALVAAASERYRADVHVELEIAYLGVHSQPNDGWSTPDGVGSTSQMLDEFQTAWSPAAGGAWPVEADLAHFLSGSSLGGGIAYIGVLCNDDYGFAVSSNLNAAIDWSSWSGASGPLTWDFVVFTHELGHNLGSLHTHSYCPPLDRCASSCAGGSACSRGTLMSYCHLCAGGLANVDLLFHNFTADAMREAHRTSCLGWSTLQPAGEMVWSLRFQPTATGSRPATLSFEHSAPNAPTSFTLELRGTGSP